MARGAACAIGLVACLAAWGPAAGRAAGEAQAGQERTVGGPVTVAQGRRPLTRGRWRLRALVRRVPAPVPGQPDRTEDLPCLRLFRQGAFDSRCLGPEPELWRGGGAAAPPPHPERRRVPGGHPLWGFGGGRGTQLTRVLGGGRPGRLRPRPLPGS